MFATPLYLKGLKVELSDTNHPQAHLDDSEHAAKRTFLGSVKNRVHPFVVKLNVATVTAALLAITGTAAYFVLYAGEQRQAPEINLKQIIKSNSTDQPGQVALGTTAGVVSGVQQPDAALPDHAAASTSGTSTPAAAVAVAGASSNPTAVATVAGAKDVKETTIEERNSSAEQLLALYSRVGELELQVKQMARDLNSTRIANAKDKTAKVKESVTPEQMIALTILDITPQKVRVSDSVKTYVVDLGASLPGGAVFLAYDETSKVMRTDRGNFVIR